MAILSHAKQVSQAFSLDHKRSIISLHLRKYDGNTISWKNRSVSHCYYSGRRYYSFTINIFNGDLVKKVVMRWNEEINDVIVKHFKCMKWCPKLIPKISTEWILNLELVIIQRSWKYFKNSNIIWGFKYSKISLANLTIYSKVSVSKFQNLVIIPDFWWYRFVIFHRFVKRFCQGFLTIFDNFVEKRSDGNQHHRVRWHSIPSKFLFHKKCYMLFSKHYVPILTHFVQKCFHGIEYRQTFFTQKCQK